MLQVNQQQRKSTHSSPLKADVQRSLNLKVNIAGSLQQYERDVLESCKATHGVETPAKMRRPKYTNLDISRFQSQMHRGGFDQPCGSHGLSNKKPQMVKLTVPVSTVQQGQFVPRETSKVQLRNTSFKPSLSAERSSGVTLIRGRYGKA